MERALDLLSAAFPALHSTIFIVGISCNATLLTAVYFRTPQPLRSYSVMITAGVLNDIITICIDLFTMNRILGIPGNMFYILSTGPCSLISPQVCYWAYCYQMASILYSIYAMAASFAFRLWVLHLQSPKSGNVLLIMIAIFIPPAVAMYLFTFDQGNVDYIRKIVNASLPMCLSEAGALTGMLHAQLILPRSSIYATDN